MFSAINTHKHPERKSSDSKQRMLLPTDYRLGDNDVYCGRGTLCFYHSGNQRFRDIVAANLPRYINSTNKTEKSFIIYEIVDFIRQTSPHGGFVKKDLASGRYMEVGDFCAREKTSQAFRDATIDRYKSSKLSKTSKKLSKEKSHSIESDGNGSLIDSRDCLSDWDPFRVTDLFDQCCSALSPAQNSYHYDTITSKLSAHNETDISRLSSNESQSDRYSLSSSAIDDIKREDEKTFNLLLQFTETFPSVEPSFDLLKW